MKLSQLTTNGTADALLVLTPSVNNIVKDDAIIESVGKIIDFSKAENLYGQITLLLGRITEILPLLLGDHRADVFAILSVLNECTPEEIGAQNIMKTMRQVREAVQDKELIDFFKSFMPTGTSEQSAPSALSQD